MQTHGHVNDILMLNKIIHTKGAKRDTSNSTEVRAHPSADNGRGEFVASSLHDDCRKYHHKSNN